MRAGLIVVLLCLAGFAHAEQGSGPVRYISDELVVTLRKGEGMESQVSALVKAGTRVELLDAGSEGYAKVRVAPGREGWVLAKYLSNEPPARERVAALSAKLAEKQAEVRKLEARLTRVESGALDLEPADDEEPTDAGPGEEEQKPVVDTLTAVGLVVAGVLIGLILPMLPGRRRKKWTPDL